MGLSVITSASEQLVSDLGFKEIKSCVDASGSALVFCPSFSAVLAAQKEFADRGLSFSVTCTTTKAWTKLRWNLYGDNRSLVTSGIRNLLVAQLFEGDVAPLNTSSGTQAVVRELVKQALPYLDGLGSAPESELTDGEKRTVELAQAYAHKLEEHNLVEETEALVSLPRIMSAAGAKTNQVFFVGYTTFDFATKKFIAELLDVCDVYIIARVYEGPAGELVRSQLDALTQEIDPTGKMAPVEDTDKNTPERAPEIQALIDAIYKPEEPVVLKQMGAVEFLEPAGPLAEAEVAAQYIQMLSTSGAQRIVVACPDVANTWRELAHKLYARGISVRARMSVPILQADASASFLRFAADIAYLYDLSLKWPESKADPNIDMSWWPPLGISDFMISRLSGVPNGLAYKLDASWRGNRILTPSDLIADLKKSTVTSKRLASCVTNLCQGKLKASIGALLENAFYLPIEDHAALTAVSEAASDLSRLHINLKQENMTLERYIELVCCALEGKSIITYPELLVEDSTCSVQICSARDVSQLAPCSADAIVWLGLDAEHTEVSVPDGAKYRLFEHLGMGAPADGLDEMHHEFGCALRVPKTNVALMRASHDVKAQETLDAVVLTEVFECYGFDEEKKNKPLLVSLPQSRRDEGLVEENLSSAGTMPDSRDIAAPDTTSKLDEKLKRFVALPQFKKQTKDDASQDTDGQPDASQDTDDQKDASSEELPSLSASQIESYLECPYKWFTLRRLGLDTSDAEFSSASMGTFAHRVLEITHRALLFEAAEREGLITSKIAADPSKSHLKDDEFFYFDNPEKRLEGSRVDAQNLEHAKEILDKVFEEHMLHQRFGVTKKAGQSLVPHTQREKRLIDAFKRDMLSTLDFEATKFKGYEPRLFEGKFGKADQPKVTYAGVSLNGTIDRIDVDEQGHAIVIDYKNVSKLYEKEKLYCLHPAEEDASSDEFELPYRVQTLIYAQVAKRLLKDTDIKVVGALYMSTGNKHDLAGALSGECAYKIWGDGEASDEKIARNCVPVAGAKTLDELLDRTEEAIADALKNMRAGYVEANPRTPKACDYCPVLNCERRAN